MQLARDKQRVSPRADHRLKAVASVNHWKWAGSARADLSTEGLR